MSLDFNHAEFTELQNLDALGRPKWVTSKSKPCECHSETQTLREVTGYSDCCYLEVICKKCGHVWVAWIEG